ncbi:hypothetical protein [Sutcliffiella rhizosphaerae]|uniref:hypothetical protein n=1 Tax=Sutcliffiella rhizosphaerae TaxID=2880967 RepID=UPI001E2D17B9|nr:hypothetical protein [Sutcliffiella rhizosphaerae]
MILPLPSIFTISLPNEGPNVFPVKVDSQTILCPICQGKTIRHEQSRRLFRHEYAWNIGVLWMELAVLVNKIVKRCQGIMDVSHEYQLPYTTVER